MVYFIIILFALIVAQIFHKQNEVIINCDNEKTERFLIVPFYYFLLFGIITKIKTIPTICGYCRELFKQKYYKESIGLFIYYLLLYSSTISIVGNCLYRVIKQYKVANKWYKIDKEIIAYTNNFYKFYLVFYKWYLYEYEDELLYNLPNKYTCYLK